MTHQRFLFKKSECIRAHFIWLSVTGISNLLSSLYQNYGSLLFKEQSHSLSPVFKCHYMKSFIFITLPVLILHYILCLLGMGSCQWDMLSTSLRRWPQVRWIAFFFFFSLSSRELLILMSNCSSVCLFSVFQLAGLQAKLAWMIIFWVTHELCMNRLKICQVAFGWMCVS